MSSEYKIIGLWENTNQVDEEPAGALKFLFLPDKKFAYFEQNLSAIPNGLELGTYELSDNVINYDLSFDGIRNIGSDAGLSESITSMRIISSNTDTLNLDLIPYTNISLGRVDFDDSSNEIVGVWYLRNQQFGDEFTEKNDAYLIFSDSYFWVLDFGEKPVYGFFDGLEYGSYAYDLGNSKVNLSFDYNGTKVGSQDVGLSNRGPEILVNIKDGKDLEVRIPNTQLSLHFEKISFDEDNNKPDSLLIGSYSLTLIAEVFGQVFVLQDLKEEVGDNFHYIEYNNIKYDYSEIDPYIFTVSRDNEFTDEFAQEIQDAFPTSAGISYDLALALVGIQGWEDALKTVAAHDGFILA